MARTRKTKPKVKNRSSILKAQARTTNNLAVLKKLSNHEAQKA